MTTSPYPNLGLVNLIDSISNQRSASSRILIASSGVFSFTFPTTDTLLVGIPSEIVKTLPLSSLTAMILVAHDYKYDLPILRHVLSSPVGYIGVLGSRRRGEGLLKFLREEGVTEAALQRIRIPIGLDLGGRSAPEIALAILAEVVSSRYGGSNLPLSLRGRAQGKDCPP